MFFLPIFCAEVPAIPLTKAVISRDVWAVLGCLFKNISKNIYYTKKRKCDKLTVIRKFYQRRGEYAISPVNETILYGV